MQEEEDSKDGVGATFSKHVNRQTRGGDGMSTVCDDYVFILEVEMTNYLFFTSPASLNESTQRLVCVAEGFFPDFRHARQIYRNFAAFKAVLLGLHGGLAQHASGDPGLRAEVKRPPSYKQACRSLAHSLSALTGNQTVTLLTEKILAKKGLDVK